MRKLTFMVMLVLILLIFTSCESPKISEDEAVSIVLESHSRGSEEAEIKAVSHRFGEYKVEWEIDAACEFGTDYIDDQSGKMVKGEETNC
ncbi:hypothetical protein ACTWPF_03580 [Oceanobacillus sp. M65]|uniref:hypothetical protein n=1 Tax=Oceanobacillus sp. M65 TaxID=3457435 RepID=UPI003FCD1913